MAGAVNFIIAAIFMGSVLVVATIAMMIFLGIWTYRDAKEKGLNSALWTLVVLLVPSFIGLIVYLVVRYDTKKVTCSNCMEKVNGNSRQKKVLTGLFVSIGVMLLAFILMICFVLSGIVRAVSSGIRMLSEVISEEPIESLAGLEELVDVEDIHVRLDGEDICFLDEEENELFYIDTTDDTCEIDWDAVKALMDEYAIDYGVYSEKENVTTGTATMDGAGVVFAEEKAMSDKTWKESERLELRTEGRDREISLISVMDEGDKEVYTVKGIDELNRYLDALEKDRWTEIAKLPADATKLGGYVMYEQKDGYGEGELAEQERNVLYKGKNETYYAKEVIKLEDESEVTRYYEVPMEIGFYILH